MEDERNMPEDNDIGPFEFENDTNEPDHPKAWVTDRESAVGMMPEPYKVTGEDVAALLHHIHSHGDEIHNDIEYASLEDLEEFQSAIYYSEKELLPVLEALGLPKPIWKYSMSIEEWKNKKR